MMGRGGSMSGGQNFPVAPPAGIGGKVCRLSNLPSNVTEPDVLETCQTYGNVDYVLMEMPGVFLVEFELAESAKASIIASKQGQLQLLGQQVFCSQSQHHQIPRTSKLESAQPTNCLVVFVNNVQKSVTVKTIRLIVERAGTSAVRIAIHQEDKLFALMEFDSIDGARAIKHKLNGCDIFSGCCTLKVDYANLSKVKVTPGDPNCYDATVSEQMISAPRVRPGLLGEEDDQMDASGGFMMGGAVPQMAGGQHGGMMARGRGGGMGPGGDGGRMQMPSLFDDVMDEGMGGGHMMMGGRGRGGMGPRGRGMGPGMGMGPRGMPPPDMGMMGGMPDGTGVGMEYSCIALFGLDERTNCEHLFNLFCCYGNVCRILFMRNKQGTALIQMGDPVAQQRAMMYLNKAPLFGKRVMMSQGTNDIVRHIAKPEMLADGTPTFADYSQTRQNRYLSAGAASLNKLSEPKKSLYFFNAPADMEEDDLLQLFEEHSGTRPVKYQAFPISGAARSLAGFVDFEGVDQAVDALATCNHVGMYTKAGKQHLLKLAFLTPNDSPTGAPDPGGEMMQAYMGMMGSMGGGGRGRGGGGRGGGGRGGGGRGRGGRGGGGSGGLARGRNSFGRGGGGGRPAKFEDNDVNADIMAAAGEDFDYGGDGGASGGPMRRGRGRGRGRGGGEPY